MGIFWGTSLENRRLASHCYVQLSPAWAHDFPSLSWRAVRVYNFSNAPFFPLWQFIVIFCFTLSVCSFCFVYTLSYLHCLLFSAFFSSFFVLFWTGFFVRKIANLRNEVQNSNGNWNGNDRVDLSWVCFFLSLLLLLRLYLFLLFSFFFAW